LPAILKLEVKKCNIEQVQETSGPVPQCLVSVAPATQVSLVKLCVKLFSGATVIHFEVDILLNKSLWMYQNGFK